MTPEHTGTVGLSRGRLARTVTSDHPKHPRQERGLSEFSGHGCDECDDADVFLPTKPGTISTTHAFSG